MPFGPISNVASEERFMKCWLHLAIQLPLVLAVGCECGDGQDSSVHEVAATSAEDCRDPIERLNYAANNEGLNKCARAEAVFSLFRHFLKPGDRADRVRSILRNTNWLEEARIVYFCVLGGWIPVAGKPGDRSYALHLFADEEGRSDWVIYFVLTGGSEWNMWHRDVVAFFEGRQGSKGTATLGEFALVHPDGRIERFEGTGK